MQRDLALQSWLEGASLTDRLIMPFFVTAGTGERQPIENMPGIFKLSADMLLPETDRAVKEGLRSIMLFECHSKKEGSYPGGDFLAEAITSIKRAKLKLTIIADLCICSRTKDGHCRFSDKSGFDEKKTLEEMKLLAVKYARAGADIISPSAMLAGQTKAVRKVLDSEGLIKVMVMPAVKFASAYFRPARETFSMNSLETTKPYQLRQDDRKGALAWCRAERDGGADVLMIKPALHALDVIVEAKRTLGSPIVAFQPSGIYSMLHLAARGWGGQRRELVMEQLTSIIRAGADKIVTYDAIETASWQGG